MFLRPSIILSLCLTLAVAIKRQGHGGHGSHGLKQEDFAGAGEEDVDNPLKKEDFIGNKEHLLEHLKDHLKIDEEKLNDLSEAETNFVFFKAHDFNNDDKLDGIELYQSILHGLEHDFEKIEESNDHKGKAIMINSMLHGVTMAVDKILRQDDKDRDGYLSYDEFAYSRRAMDMLKQASGE